MPPQPVPLGSRGSRQTSEVAAGWEGNRLTGISGRVLQTCSATGTPLASTHGLALHRLQALSGRLRAPSPMDMASREPARALLPPEQPLGRGPAHVCRQALSGRPLCSHTTALHVLAAGGLPGTGPCADPAKNTDPHGHQSLSASRGRHKPSSPAGRCRQPCRRVNN